MPKTNDKTILAILSSDWHLSSKTPLARAEHDWFPVMEWALKQIRDLQEKYFCPVIVAGDLFDRWNSRPKLVNFALANIPNAVWAVSGQHDQPYHSLKQLDESAYWTVCEAGKVGSLDSGAKYGLKTNGDTKLFIHGFPWGTPIHPLTEERRGKEIHLAVVHKYIWTKKHKHQNATEESNLKNFNECLRGYDASVFGDNHSGFLAQTDEGKPILNSGCLIRRRSDERGYTPSVGLLYDDGTIERHPLDCSDDKWHEPERIIHGSGLPETYRRDFLKELNKMGSDPLDFKEAVLRVLDNHKMTSEGQRRLILESLDMEGY